MAGDFTLPYLEVEQLLANVEVLDERDTEHVFLPLFQRKMQRGSKIVVRTMTRRAAQVRHTSAGGRAVPIERGELTERLYLPCFIKQFDTITAEDLMLFEDAANASNGRRLGGGGVDITSADERIMQISQYLRDDNTEERHRLMIGAMLGEVTILDYDAPAARTVGFGLTNITPPSTAWDDVDATIIADIELALQTFQSNHRSGKKATDIYVPRGAYANWFYINTEWNAKVDKIPAFVQGSMRAGGTNPFSVYGDILSSLFGVRWHIVEGTYMARHATTNALSETARWPEDTVVLCNLAEAQPRWQMCWDPLQNPTPRMNIEIGIPEKGDDVKAIKVVSFDNGLPMFLDPSAVQPWVVG